jgi:hypothetical protein
MGMGTGACYGWTISYDNLKKICPKEIADVESVKEFEDWGEVSRGIDYCEDLPAGVQTAIQSLIESFAKSTGLTLSFAFYNEDDGDRYDSVDEYEGCVFLVDGMWSYTPAGEKFKDVVKQQLWTQFG